MPYVDHATRKALDSGIPATAPGHLNYLITKLGLQYIETRGKNYQTLNDVLGAFDAAKAEFYRRMVAPYEDHKIETNGDVYPERK